MSLQLYLTDIRPLAATFDQGFALLPPARQARIRRCRRETVRLQSLAAGLLLRRILSITTDCQLHYTLYGKPYLPEGLHFNLSHSGNLAALAVYDAPVGIDLQELSDTVPHGVAARYFTEAETAWIAQCPERFYRVWTRKESVVKALGLGLLSCPIASFSVLEDSVSVCATPLYLATQRMDQTVLSIAAQTPLPSLLQPVVVSASQLLH